MNKCVNPIGFRKHGVLSHGEASYLGLALGSAESKPLGITIPRLNKEAACGLGILALLILASLVDTAYQMGVL